MANLILTDAGWEGRVRGALGVNEAYLPDSAIQQPDIIEIAESNIINLVPGYAALTSKDAVYLKAATVLECAVLLCPSMPQRLPVQTVSPHMEIKLNSQWEKMQAKLEAQRDSYLDQLITAINMVYFKVT